MDRKYQTSAQLKERARIQMTGNYGLAIAMLVLVEVASFVASALFSGMVSTGSLAGYLISQGISYLLSALLGVTNVGIALFCLNIICGQPRKISDLIYGFRTQLDKSLLLSLFVSLFSVLLVQVVQLPLFFLDITKFSSLLILYTVMILAVIAYVYASLLFSQVFYLLLDHPSLSTGEILRYSMRIMKGHKKRLLYIQLSFIPLYLLAFLTLGIGLLWVFPYQNMTAANFYLDLMNPQGE